MPKAARSSRSRRQDLPRPYLPNAKIDEDQFWLSTELGSGTYGVVYKARVIPPKDSDLMTKEGGYEELERRKNEFQLVAMKEIKFTNGSTAIPSSALREMGLLKELKHPNIISLLRVVYQNFKLFLVFELATEDLHSYIHRTKTNGTRISEATAKVS
ncbi:hypothetical protein SARC_08151 [Sphaeroforma arctica JP610]|uniref:Protein kinase domain-containing protein n=1 Tax=Sphaeroforma arctica JP610 TaxID=667725 RepID=A0A0L0FRX9_9EUKA|nr:hypothetical protein SARC_08151 [Sphaeroforma arctica JP610]KNC79454.1 hypothetical protein SARC_08151 [Sphaeroforma arctica JP610]|eukprot:XP_014153356.1 hypothetical protein SARC_08151 [Sphaeroforma arctica JP610]